MTPSSSSFPAPPETPDAREQRFGEDAPYRRALVVANPIAGRGQGRSTADELVAGLRRWGVRTEVHFTEARSDAQQRVAAVESDTDLVVVVGGDGTLREVLEALPRPEIPIGILPGGTANVLARELELPRDVHSTLEMIMRGKRRKIDVARVNGQLCFLVTGIGADAEAVREVERRRSGPITKWAYVRAILWVARTYTPPRLMVEVDGETVEGEYGLVLISNARSYADLLRLDPGTRLDDGVYEVYLFEAQSRWQLVKIGLLGLFGRLPGSLGSLRRARHVIVREAPGAPPTPYQLDGDYRGETPIEVQLSPVQLVLLVP